MREIKFRAWNKGIQQMTLFNLFNIVKEIHLRKQCELMQFTGLKDKNGKEIYEGDVCIVDYFEDGSWKSNVGEICFEKSSFIIGLKQSEGEPFIYMHENEVYFNVIGNIYENPELLEDAQSN